MYADAYERPITFEKGEHVFLCGLVQLESSKIGPTPKWLPQFCSPFKILKKIGALAYKLYFPTTSKVHPIFHVSCLRKQIYNEDNVVDEEFLFEFIKDYSPSLVVEVVGEGKPSRKS